MKNRLWGGASTPENLKYIRRFPHHFANEDHCLVVSDRKPRRFIEMTDEFLKRFGPDDWRWVYGLTDEILERELREDPDRGRAALIEQSAFLERFEEELKRRREQGYDAGDRS